MRESYHREAPPDKIKLIARRRCFRCDSFMFRIGRTIAVHCVEGTVVEFSICGSCARKTPAPMQQRAALSIGSEVAA